MHSSGFSTRIEDEKQKKQQKRTSQMDTIVVSTFTAPIAIVAHVAAVPDRPAPLKMDVE